MTSDLPPEAHHYRRSQTPESPRPLHIPEPSTIPVLQNQMDPVFNDTKTYNIAPNSPYLSKTSDDNSAVHVTSDAPPEMPNTAPELECFSAEKSPAGVQISGTSNLVLNGTRENTAISSNSYAHSSNATAPDLQRTLDSLAQFNETASATSEQAQPLPGSGTTSENDPLPKQELSANDFQPQSDNAVRPDSADATSKGVNYQSLLDTLSQSTATASAADTLTVPTTASTQESTDISRTGAEKRFPVVAGLPPRPPPQEKPAIHPNYSPNETIQSYHQFPPQSASAGQYQSQTTSYRQSTGIGTAGNIPPPQINARAANGLPPPPLATFQQSPASAAPIQSPSVQSLRDSAGRATQSPTQRHESQGTDDEEQPWGTDTQKKYDQFLHDERIYVTEGVWDRFPPGSRLFVGEHITLP
jgi:hypothetical protein